jgi:hypothetical protein
VDADALVRAVGRASEALIALAFGLPTVAVQTQS